MQADQPADTQDMQAGQGSETAGGQEVRPALRFLQAARVTVAVGVAGTGKTEALVERVRAALAAGTAPDQVLVLAATASGARALAWRIAVACGAAGAQVQVTTPIRRALELIATEDARAALQGRTHMLSDVEVKFFLEDMRVTGEKQRRLREMLKFLQRGWSEMREEDEGWLITGEEVALNDFARTRLTFMEGLLPVEVAPMCVRYLLGAPAALDGARRALVVADDFRMMSRASQRLARLLAREELSVAWDALGGLTGEEPYGYAEGLAELAEEAAACGAAFERTELAESHQAAAPHGLVANLFHQACLADSGIEAPALPADAASGSFAVVPVPDLNDEMGSIVATVQGFLAQGMAPEDVFLAVPTDAWARRVSASLAQAGVPASRIEGRQAIGGDIRDLAKCGPAVVYTALHLAADPDSAAAWRAWCGFGDWLACSTGMNTLMGRAVERGARVPELLAEVAAGADAETAADTAKLRARYAAGCDLLAAVEGLRGPELLERIAREALGDVCADVPQAVRGLVGKVGPEETAAELFARAERALVAPVFAPEAVRVGGVDALVGQSLRVVVFCGCVNGLVPPIEYFDLSMATIEAQDKMHRRLVESLIAAVGKARETVVCSTFAHAGIVESETLHLKSERVRLRDGARVCDLGPSVVVQYLCGEALDLQR